MRFERRLKAKTSIDMTPLVDVILQLIIFFLITTTFKTTPGIELALPSSSTAKPVIQEPLKVVVMSQDRILVGKSVADLRGLPEALRREIGRLDAAAGKASAATVKSPAAAGKASTAEGAGTRRALVEGDSGIPYQLLVSVLDTLRKEGISAIGLATRTAEGPPP